jgi:hypothetical protein
VRFLRPLPRAGEGEGESCFVSNAFLADPLTMVRSGWTLLATMAFSDVLFKALDRALFPWAQLGR